MINVCAAREHDKLRLCALDFEKLIGNSNHSLIAILSRRRDIVDERQRIAKELRKLDYSYPQIASVMNRDHTAIMHLCKVRN